MQEYCRLIRLNHSLYNCMVLKMDTLLPLKVKIPFFETELLYFNCLIKEEITVSIALIMIASYYQGLLYFTINFIDLQLLFK